MFNNALLVKQSWNVLIKPKALWVRVLKEVYFYNEDFLEARKGGRALWMWSNLL